jgi:hypothetical protein
MKKLSSLFLCSCAFFRGSHPSSSCVIAVYTDKADFTKQPVELGYIRFGVLGNAFEIE